MGSGLRGEAKGGGNVWEMGFPGMLVAGKCGRVMHAINNTRRKGFDHQHSVLSVRSRMLVFSFWIIQLHTATASFLF